MATTKPVVAAFDFDGTLTTRDTLLPFLRFYAGPAGFALGMARSIATITAYGLRMMRNDVAKERLLQRFLRGADQAALAQCGQQYARKRLPQLVRSTALNRLRWHQAQGHRVVIVSASLDIYLKPWAEEIGIDQVLCTSLESSADGRISGRLGSVNCYGPEKLRRLRDSLGDPSDYILYAYGDSRGDRELLASADHSFYRRFTEAD